MEQNEHLESVSTRIATSIKQFVEQRKTTNPDFHADELRTFVAKQTGKVAPASADRVLRDLRIRGIINYQVISRSKSLYRIVPLVVNV